MANVLSIPRRQATAHAHAVGDCPICRKPVHRRTHPESRQLDALARWRRQRAQAWPSPTVGAVNALGWVFSRVVLGGAVAVVYETARRPVRAAWVVLGAWVVLSLASTL